MAMTERTEYRSVFALSLGISCKGMLKGTCSGEESRRGTHRVGDDVITSCVLTSILRAPQPASSGTARAPRPALCAPPRSLPEGGASAWLRWARAAVTEE